MISQEKPCWKRARLQGERVYFKKWHYVKYCTAVIQHSSQHKLSFGSRALDAMGPKSSGRLAERQLQAVEEEGPRRLDEELQ